jgi:hypothetical protein
MQNSQTNTSKIDNKIVLENSALDDRQVITVAPLQGQVRRLFRWEKLLASISVGLGIMMMGVGTIEYPGQSIALRQSTVRESIDRQPLPAIATTSNPTTNQDPHPAATSAKPDRLQIAKAALQDAKVALALSQADVEQADINIETFQNEYERYQDLYKRGAGNRQKLVQAKSGYDFAKRQKSYALHGLKQVRLQLDAAEADIDTVRARSTKICSRL